MRHKKLKVSAILILGFGFTSLQAQTMYVKESSSTQTAHALNNIRAITFSGGNANIQKTDNSTSSYALSDLSYIRFDDPITGVKEYIGWDKSISLTAYPNPLNDVLSVDLSKLINKTGTLRVLSLEGRTMLTQQTQGAETEIVNMSTLTKGIYFCQFANENETQTVKIIKQ